jgi:uncharacterized protein YhfF
MHSRHGLPTVEFGEPGENRRHLTALMLARGTGTMVRVRYPTDEAEAVRVGDRLLLIDQKGRSAAVLEVDAVEQTTIGRLNWPDAAVEGRCESEGSVWTADPPGRPRAAGEPEDPTTPVTCVSFHIVGHGRT